MTIRTTLRSIAACMLLQTSFAATAENWQRIEAPTHAIDVGIGADGSAWMVAADGTYRGHITLSDSQYPVAIEHELDAARYMNFIRFIKLSDVGGVAIDVDPQGNAWVVRSDGSIHHWQNGAFVQIPGQAQDIGISPTGEVWIVGTQPAGRGDRAGYELLSWNGTAWQAANYPNSGYGAVRVSVGQYQPYSSDNSGELSQRVFNTVGFSQRDEAGKLIVGVGDVAVGGHPFFPNASEMSAENVYWILGSGMGTDANGNSPLYRWDRRTDSLAVLTSGMGTRIATGPSGQPLVVNAQGEIYVERSGMTRSPGSDVTSRSANRINDYFGMTGLSYRLEYVAEAIFGHEDIVPGDMSHGVPYLWAYPGQEVVIKVVMPKMPDVVGKSAADGVAELQAQGFTVTRADVWDTDDPSLEGKISQTMPEAGTPIEPGTQVWYVHWR